MAHASSVLGVMMTTDVFGNCVVRLGRRPTGRWSKSVLAAAGLCLIASMPAPAATPNASEPLLQQAAQGNRQALQRIRQAAAQGNTQAETDLGILYAHGDGVPQNYTLAFSWYRKAAAQGDAVARHDIVALRRRLRREMYR